MENRKSKGAAAKNAKMTPEERKALSLKMTEAKKERAGLPKVTHTGSLKIGELEIPCYVTEKGERALSGRGMQEALRLVDEETPASGQKPGSRMDRFLGTKSLKPLIYKDRKADHFQPMKLRFKSQSINGYKAEILPEICEAMLQARDLGMLDTPRKQIIAKQCDILMRGFARVGIIALVDEATGYQKDRTRDALAKILEAYVAKELQPYVKTFDPDFYENMFRLRGLPYPPEFRPQSRPQYFGKLTNDLVYRRLAPGVLEALKEESKKTEKKGKLFQHLTAGYGRQELLKHLGLVIGVMKLSNDWQDFMLKLNRVSPRYGDTIEIDLEERDR